MPVRAACFLMLDNKIRLICEAEIATERLDRRAPLRRRQMLVGPRIDTGLVEIISTFRASRQGAHFPKHIRYGIGAEVLDLNQLGALVRFRILQMPRPPAAGATAAAFNNDRHPGTAQKPA